MRIPQNLPKKKQGYAHWTKIILITMGILVVVMVGFAIATPIVIAILKTTPNTTKSTNTNTSVNFDIATTYGNLYFSSANDGDSGYVLINAADVVNQTSGTVTSSYVEQITLVFIVAPSGATPGIWLYVMNMNSSGASVYFTPIITYQVPYSLIGNTVGVQTMTFSSSILPITQGQYVGVGFDSNGGSCYQISNRNEYYISTAAFASLPYTSYTSSPSHGFAFTFVVRTFGYSSG